MTNYALQVALSLLFVLCAHGSLAVDKSITQGPEGQWLVKDGTAHIRIVACKEKLWGVISWPTTSDTDKNNPDPARRSRPILGLAILLGLKQAKADEWDGNIYNADNGKTYGGDISLKSADVLHVEGCVLGILCGGEDWTRLEHVSEQESAAVICKRTGNT